MYLDVTTQAETTSPPPTLARDTEDLRVESAVLVEDRPACDQRRARSFRDC
jgi:hypothetical protein